jgi:hypothetical protein
MLARIPCIRILICFPFSGPVCGYTHLHTHHASWKSNAVGDSHFLDINSCYASVLLEVSKF